MHLMNVSTQVRHQITCNEWFLLVFWQNLFLFVFYVVLGKNSDFFFYNVLFSRLFPSANFIMPFLKDFVLIIFHHYTGFLYL